MHQSSASLHSIAVDDALAALWEELTRDRVDSPNVKRNLATLASASSCFRFAVGSTVKMYESLHGLERNLAVIRERSTKTNSIVGIEDVSTKVVVESIDRAAERILAAQDAADVREKEIVTRWHGVDLS